MALWLVRAGKYGEFEPRFFDNKRVYLTFEGIDRALSGATDYDGIKAILRTCYPNEPERRIGAWSGQVWAFALPMKPGDWIATPLKNKSAIAIAEIVGDYEFDAKAEPHFRHSRRVKWLNTEIPRSAFDQDILYSLGAFLTVCEIRRNNAEKRVRAMATNGWRAVPENARQPKPPLDPEHENTDLIDLERVARDQIQKHVIARFKGHGMEELVAAILEAQGYTTRVSPEGADGGKDILAAPGGLGFGHPRICVQVKTQDTPIDRPTLDQLIGVMQKVGADQGLLVSWGGFKSSVYREASNQFFRVRLWDADDLVDQLLEHYDRISEDLRASLPLKRIWAVATPEADE